MIASSKALLKHTHIFAALILGVLVLTTGCMRHKTHDPKVKAELVFGDNADFDILKVDARPLNQENSLYKAQGWKVPYYKNYEFIVTLRDGLQGRSLRDFRFEVLEASGKPVCDARSTGETPKCEFTANAASEIRWTESIPYDFFKRDSQSALLARKIKGTGSRTGQRTVVLEINPWSTLRGLSVPEVRDITFNLSEEQAKMLKEASYDPYGALKISGNNPEQKAKVIIDSIGTQVIQSIEPFVAMRSDSAIQQSLDDREEGSLRFQNLVYSRYSKNEFVSRQKDAGLEGDFTFLRKEGTGNKAVYVYEDIDSSQNIDGLKFNFDLKMNLKYEYQIPEGATQNKPLMDGRFRVLSQLVLEPSSGAAPIILTPNMNAIVGEIFEGKLFANYQAIIPYLPSTGNIKLAVRLIPLGVEDQLSYVDYLYTLGPYKSLIGRMGDLYPDERTIKRIFNYDEYISSATGGNEAINNGYAYKIRDYSFGTMNIKFSTVEAGETASQRTVIFRVSAKVYDEATGTTAAPNTPFEIVSLHTGISNPTDKTKWKFMKITNAKDVKDPSRVNRDGEIFWYDKMSHKYYHREKLVERRVFIARWKPEFESGNFDFVEEVKNFVEGKPTSKGVNIQELKMYINPWDERFGTFGTDASIASESFIKNIEGREKIESRFFIGNFRYETLRFRYEIGKSMDLNVKKTVLLTLDPLVLRYSSILQGINAVDRIRDGFYILKAALQKDYLDPAARDYVLQPEPVDAAEELLDERDMREIVVDAPPGDSKLMYGDDYVGTQHGIPYGDPRRKRSISFVKKLVRVNSGRIITPIEFSIEDLRLMRIRSQIFVQLQLVNQVKLQVVNIVKERFEKIFQFETGKVSPILAKLSEQDQTLIKFQMQKVLDAIADSIDDDIYITQVEDLEKIIQDPKVISAMDDLERSKLGYLLKDVLIDLKREFESKIASTIAVTDDTLSEVVDERNQELAEREQVATEAARLAAESRRQAVDPVTQGAAGQCESLNPVKVLSTGEVKFDLSKENADIDPVTMAYIPFDTGVFPENYADRLSQFQPFKDAGKQFFKNLLNEATLNRILTNDFTVSAAFGPVSDLDKLHDKDSGIRSRTFVGPMTFLYNTNSGSLRPTDNLDEAYCVTDDCNSLNTSLASQYGVIENFEYEKSPYHGSIAHFQNVVFEDQTFVDESGQTKVIEGIESMYKRLKAAKEVRAQVDGMLTRFLDTYDLSYLSLKDIAPDRLVCTDNVLKGSHCYKKDTQRYIPLNRFFENYSEVVKGIVDQDYKNKNKYEANFQNLLGSLASVPNRSAGHNLPLEMPYGFISEQYNVGLDRCQNVQSNVCQESNKSPGLWGLTTNYDVALDYVAPTRDELLKIIKQPYKGQSMVASGHAKFTPEDQFKMCDLFVYGEIAPKAYKKYGNDKRKLARLRANLFAMATTCKDDVTKGLEPLALERRFRINETGRYYFLGGKSMNVQSTQDVKLSSSLRVSRAFGVRPLRLITGIIEKGSTFSSKISGLLLGSLDFTYNMARDRGFNEGSGVNKGTYLVMQNAEFEIELKSYEQCIVARWNPVFVERQDRRFGFSEGEFTEDIVAGMMICSGEVENTPIAVKEKYYYFTQHFTEGDMLDPADIHNHPWLLALRGVREFNTFMLALQSYEQDGAGNKTEREVVDAEEMIGYFDMWQNDAENVKQRMAGSYNPTDHYKIAKRTDWPIDQMVKTYNRTMPTFPGMYTQLDEEEYNERTWPWGAEAPGEVMKASARCQ